MVKEEVVEGEVVDVEEGVGEVVEEGEEIVEGEDMKAEALDESFGFASLFLFPGSNRSKMVV